MMAPSKGFTRIRWASRFLRADAEQPVGVLRMVLRELRQNQWVLLEWLREPASHFYPVRKREISPILNSADVNATVVSALHLDELSASEAVRSRNVDTVAAELDVRHPWISRKVLLDIEGNVVAIGIPPSPPKKEKPADQRSHAVGGMREGAEEVIASRADYGASMLIEQAPDSPRKYSTIRVFYGTDRARGAGNIYSNFRDDKEAIHLGFCDVTIPRDHKMQQLESPRWWKFEFTWNPRKHIVLQRVNELPEAEFVKTLRTYVAEATRPEAFVFVHGFDVSFQDAARRTAQLSYDLGFKGAPILFSWPSAGSIKGYMADEATIEWTRPHLISFLKRIVSQTGIERLHVVAHSMGNRAVAKAMKDLCPIGTPFFKQIVLAAPDIDTGEFLQLAASIGAAGERTTMYSSSNDKALELSKKLHFYPRAGESGQGIVVIQGLDTVDASSVDTSLLGHSYYGDNRTIISDIFYLLEDGKPPSERHGLDEKQCSKGLYWAFRE